MRPRPGSSPLVLAIGLVLLVLATLLPSGAAAQDDPLPGVSDVFELQVDVSEAAIDYGWSISQPGAQWQLEMSGPDDQTVRLELKDGDGTVLARSNGLGRAAMFDLALVPGDYILTLPKGGGDAHPVRLASSIQAQAYDPEPNDAPEVAVPIVDGGSIIGRLARVGHDDDYFALDIPPGDAMLRDLSLTWDGEQHRRLCLVDAAGQDLQCRQDAGHAVLTDLALEPGGYGVRVDGSSDATRPYRLDLQVTGEGAFDYESEPNDDVLTADPVDLASGIQGRSDRSDFDHIAVDIEGEPQLWKVEASGAQIDQLALVRHNGDIAVSRPACSGEPARLDDLILVPGTHRFRVRACEGDYAVTLTPLGPRDPEGEREPNGDDVRAEAYQLGQRRIGRLVTTEDYDRFRFTVASPEHVRLRLEQPPDGRIDVQLSTSGAEILRAETAEPGEDLDVDLWLASGDYMIRLWPRAPSEGTYVLTTQRLDPFSVPPDAEPNDRFGYARPAPATLAWHGTTVGAAQDVDGYWLPPLSVAGTIRISVDGERPSVRLYSDPRRNERVEVVREDDGTFAASDAPVGVPLYLELSTQTDYAVALDAPGWQSVPVPAPLPVEVSLQLDEDLVAAYWPEGQRVAATIRLANTGSEPLEVALDSATSHYAWELRPEVDMVDLPTGASVDVPAVLLVRPDVWADAPVLVSVEARAADGGFGVATAIVDGGRDADAVDSFLAWPVPDALLGGLDVAGAALGGVPGGTVDLDREVFLYDDVTPAGGGFGISASELPLELIVDLAGDEAVPIAGTILNPLAYGSSPTYMVRDFELLLSDDGETWRSVLRDELERTPIDQSFVLDAAAPATHAMLRIHSLHGDGNARFPALGEWKVIAVPGALPDPMPTNIADPVRGGYTARVAPFFNGFADWGHLLDEDMKARPRSLDRDVDDEMEIVIGFQEGRAAQVSELRWLDPEGSIEEERVRSVDLDVTVGGPLGPWRRVASWDLERAPDGTVAPLVLDSPVWARYVRLRGDLPAEDVRRIEFPGRIEVHERATDDAYRSILGEWGYTSDRGPYELMVPPAITTTQVGPDAGDSVDQATPLTLDRLRTDRAEILEDVDWYRIDVPPGDNSLRLDLDGVPTVGVLATLYSPAGAEVALTGVPRPDGGVRYEAVVDPGASYDLLVEQPPFNVVFTFDTSGSMGPYLDFVLEGMRVFASDVEPGREAAMIVPFDKQPLLPEWTDQPVLLEAAVNDFVRGDDSSNIERGLQAGAALLAARDGVRAVLAVGDAETGTLNEAPDVWSAFDTVQPVVYTVHVGADGKPEETRNLMRAWSDSNGGVYSYPTTHAEMERSFERMSTRLRRPATYSLLPTTAFVDRSPASLSVVAPAGPSVLAPGIGIEVILDTSGSMREALEGTSRMTIARRSLLQLLDDGLAPGVPFALRSFESTGKSRAQRCQTTLSIPLAPLDATAALKTVKGLKARKKTRTPIADALLAVSGDLASVTGSRTVLLITDGDETCDGDPAAAIEQLQAEGIDITLNIVGFALDDEELKTRMAEWAEAGAGSYFDAAGADELVEAIVAAVRAPYRVYADGSDELIATGTVGGAAVTLDPGRYHVEVLTDPMVTFDEVVLDGGTTRSLMLAPDHQG